MDAQIKKFAFSFFIVAIKPGGKKPQKMCKKDASRQKLNTFTPLISVRRRKFFRPKLGEFNEMCRLPATFVDHRDDKFDGFAHLYCGGQEDK